MVSSCCFLRVSVGEDAEGEVAEADTWPAVWLGVCIRVVNEVVELLAAMEAAALEALQAISLLLLCPLPRMPAAVNGAACSEPGVVHRAAGWDGCDVRAAGQRHPREEKEKIVEANVCWQCYAPLEVLFFFSFVLFFSCLFVSGLKKSKP